MKRLNVLVILLIFVCTFSSQNTIAQTNPGGAQINAITTAVPFIIKPLQFDMTTAKGSVSGIVPEMNLSYLILHSQLDIKEIKVKAKGYDAKVLRIRATNGMLAQFKVEGHPKGTFILSLKDVDKNNNQTSGRQKNRRVEMTIEFD